MDKDEHYRHIKEKLDDKEESILIQQDIQQTFDLCETEFKTMEKCKYMLHTVQFNTKIILDTSTKMAMKDHPSNRYESYKDMIESHCYYVSTENKIRTYHNFCKIFFELNYEYMAQFLDTIKSKREEYNIQTREKLTGPIIKKDDSIVELENLYKYLTVNDNAMYVNQWCPIANIALTMWKNKVKKDKQTVEKEYSAPLAVKYQSGQKNNKLVFVVKFLFLTINDESKYVDKLFLDMNCKNMVKTFFLDEESKKEA